MVGAKSEKGKEKINADNSSRRKAGEDEKGLEHHGMTKYDERLRKWE